MASTEPLLLMVPGKEPRKLRVPIHELALVQRRICENLFVDFQPHDCSYGGVKGRSIEDNVRCHANRDFVMKIDLRKFYPNVHYQWVQSFFERRLGCIPPVASTLRRLLTFDCGLPQGACTSPALADQILGGVDTRIQGALDAQNVVYTRWVDDLTLSAAFSMRSLVPFIEKIFRRYGLRIHTLGEKRPKQFGPGEVATITGLSLDRKGISVPCEYIRTVKSELKMAAHRCQDPSAEPPPYGRDSYWGMIQYIKQYSRSDAADLMRLFEEVSWDRLLPLELSSKKGKVEYLLTPTVCE